jgi:HNH endonuclease
MDYDALNFQGDDVYLQRFFDRINTYDMNKCWEWINGRTKGGYAGFRYYFNGVKGYQGHVYSYLRFKGDIPKGLVVHHICNNRPCVNPTHLEAVTTRQNIQMGNTGQYNKIKTHCPLGHPYDEKNTRVHKNRRVCATCADSRTLFYRFKKKYKKQLELLKEQNRAN